MPEKDIWANTAVQDISTGLILFIFGFRLICLLSYVKSSPELRHIMATSLDNSSATATVFTLYLTVCLCSATKPFFFFTPTIFTHYYMTIQ